MSRLSSMANIAAIVGAYEHPSRYAPDKSEWQLMGEAARGAIQDAGLTPTHIDALFIPGTAPEGGLTWLLR
jgi:acetyl-CoA C-acetyltransferase